MNPLPTIIEFLDDTTMALLGIHFSFGNGLVLGAFFVFGWFAGKLTRRVGLVKGFFALIVGAYFYDMLKNAHFPIVWAFLLGILTNHGYLYWGVLSWARNMGDILFALRNRKAFEDIRRREAELDERERKFREQVRAEARAKGASDQQRQWKAEADARRGNASSSSGGGSQSRGGSGGDDGRHRAGKERTNSSHSQTSGGLMSQYLQTMGLDPHKTYSKADLKRAYRQRAKKVHPDMGGTSSSFQELTSQYEWLVSRTTQ